MTKTNPPKMEPLKQWICDTCHGLIRCPEDGYVEWLHGEDPPYNVRGFRIVHHAPASPRKPDGDCYLYTKHAGRNDLDLKGFVGPLGLVRLLSFIDVGPYHQREYGTHRVDDLRGWTEVFRRLHLPYYEEARLHWYKALEDGYFDGCNEVWLYMPETLKTLIERYGADT